jgi:hypothetical protein
MTRGEIASYLGLELETVSRAFSELDELGVIQVNGKNVEICNGERLRQLSLVADACTPRTPRVVSPPAPRRADVGDLAVA